MKACATVNVATGLVLLVVFAFAGCGGKNPEATSPTNAATPPTAAEPADSDEPLESPAGTTDEPGGATESDEGDPDTKGDVETRTTEVIQKVVQDNRKPIRACFDKARKELPDLSGTMTIHFVLDPEGGVKSAELNVERSEVKAPSVVNCAIDQLKKIKFPPSSRGMESKVNYPFSFK
jgi:predicted small lipoprotein YifL